MGPGHEHWAPFTAEFKNECSYNSTSPYVFIVPTAADWLILCLFFLQLSTSYSADGCVWATDCFSLVQINLFTNVVGSVAEGIDTGKVSCIWARRWWIQIGVRARAESLVLRTVNRDLSAATFSHYCMNWRRDDMTVPCVIICLYACCYPTPFPPNHLDVSVILPHFKL
jgi:hypothetical protein